MPVPIIIIKRNDSFITSKVPLISFTAFLSDIILDIATGTPEANAM